MKYIIADPDGFLLLPFNKKKIKQLFLRIIEK